MKFFIVFAALIAAAAAVPVGILAPSAVTYHTSKSALVPVGTTVQHTIAQPVTYTKTLVQSAPVLAGPVGYGLGHGAVLSGPAIGYGAAPLGLGLGGLGHGAVLGAPALGLASPYGLGAPLGYGIGHGAVLGAPALGLGLGHGNVLTGPTIGHGYGKVLL